MTTTGCQHTCRLHPKANGECGVCGLTAGHDDDTLDSIHLHPTPEGKTHPQVQSLHDYERATGMALFPYQRDLLLGRVTLSQDELQSLCDGCGRAGCGLHLQRLRDARRWSVVADVVGLGRFDRVFTELSTVRVPAADANPLVWDSIATMPGGLPNPDHLQVKPIPVPSKVRWKGLLAAVEAVGPSPARKRGKGR